MTIHALLAGGADVNAKTDEGFTPLHQAAGRKMMLAALEAAAKGGRDEGLRALARATDLDMLGETDRNAFLAGLKAAADQTGAIQALLAGGADVNARDDEAGSTPLHQAAASGDVTAIRALLAGGADVNARDDAGSTPLHQAAMLGRAAIIPTLLAGGANVNARARNGVTPLHAAAAKTVLAALEAGAEGGHDELLKMFSITESFGLDTLDEVEREVAAALFRGADDDRADTIRALLAGGANVDARAKREATPLHYAALSGDAAVVEALLNVVSDPNAVAFGCSPMDVAQRRMESTETSIAPFRASIEALRAAGGRPLKECRL